MADIPVRKSRVVFIVLTLGVVLAIAATVLLANERRHLNALLLHYGLMEPPAPAAPSQPKPRRPAGKSVPLSGTRADIFLSGTGATPFARIIRFPAPDMCRLFGERGFEGEGWQPSPLADVAECTAEKTISADAAAGLPGSLFAVVRGTAEDDINSLRIKVVAPGDANGAAALEELDALLGALIEATGWSDLSPIRPRIRALEELNMTDYSLSVTFRREYTNRDAYNLIIRPTSTNPDVRKLEKPAQPGAFNR